MGREMVHFSPNNVASGSLVHFPLIVLRWVDQVVVIRSAKNSEHGGRCHLADAQFIIARSHGFDAWARFSKHLNGLKEKGSAIARFETAAGAIISKVTSRR